MNRFLTEIFFTFAFALGCSIGMGENQAVDLGLPTDNDSLFSGGGAAFYQYIERNYNSVKSTPWEGGQYGFVRDPTDTAGGVVYTRFHEGIDIRPLHRDRAPLGQLKLLQSVRPPEFDRSAIRRHSETRPANRRDGVYGNGTKPGTRASP